MTSHAVPRNMEKVERLWKGVPDRYIVLAMGCPVVTIALLLIGFFYASDMVQKAVIVIIFLGVVLVWTLWARTPKILDRSLLFGLFYLRGVAGYNLLLKYSLVDDKINKILTILNFMPDGTVKFKNGHGWLYAFDPDSVSKDMLEGFNKKSQALLNSLSDDVVFKIEVRIEPKQDAQKLTERTNDLINTEKNSAKLAHLKSIHAYSKEKEFGDVERRYYFFIGLSGKRTTEDAVTMKQKIEHGLQDKINNLDIIFSQIKNPYLLFNFYAGELR
jgi:hypothetical protein